MAMVVNETKLNAAMTATADAIRAKTGDSAQIPFDYENGKGFADAVEAIPQGGEPQWEDDDSPVIAEDSGYQHTNIRWQITEKGTLRWYRKSFEYDYMKYARFSWNNYNQMAYNNMTLYFFKVKQAEIMPCNREGYEVQLGQNCFALFPNLKVVKIPDTVTMMEKDSFNYSISLKRIVLPNTLTTLGTLRGFRGCTGLKEMIIPINITELPQECFTECSSLENIGSIENIQIIGANTFDGCVSLPFDNGILRFGSNLASIGASAFRNCFQIKEVIFNNTPQSIVNSSFTQCSNITSIKVPWAEGEVAGAPWGATKATITYNYTGG